MDLLQETRSFGGRQQIWRHSQATRTDMAFAGYLGDELAAWQAYDACAPARKGAWREPILLDQSTPDAFLEEPLRPELFAAACAEAGIPLDPRMREGYDPSYTFVASFPGDPSAHHARALHT